VLGGTAFAIWSAITLMTSDPLPEPLSPSAQPSLEVPKRRPETPAGLIRAAIDADPFYPERRRPAAAFRLPGEGIAPLAQPAIAEVPPLALIGTAVLPEGRSFAMCRVGAEAPRVVRVGDRVGEFTLKAVAQGRAVFVNSKGASVEFSVPKAGT
jgi:hypothetical protein